MEQFQLFCDEVELSTSYKVGIKKVYTKAAEYPIKTLSLLCFLFLVSVANLSPGWREEIRTLFLPPIQWIKTFTRNLLCPFQRLMGILGIPVIMDIFPRRFFDAYVEHDSSVLSDQIENGSTDI